MLTYAYRCEACLNEWDAEQRISDDALRFCPVCHQPFATRIPPRDPPPVHFKGTGWTPNAGRALKGKEGKW